MRIILSFIAICMILSFYRRPELPTAPVGYFISPVKHQVKLGGTFCELRNNHFHAGIDIKSSKGQVGDSIFAVADGQLRRIKVQRGSYGQTVYLDHDIGLTSVYAHLDSFCPDFEKLIRGVQRERKNFEVDLVLDSTVIQVQQGQFIGIMGNRGHSFGPHLHFELRTVNDETPVNPLYYGFGPKDSKKPVIRAVKVYALNSDGVEISSKRWSAQKGNNDYVINEETILVEAWRAGIGIQAYDQQNGSWNKNGIYSIRMIVNQDTLYHFEASHCSFDETHQINAHIDYADRMINNAFVHQCFVLPNNTLSMYPIKEFNGVFPVYSDRPQNVIIQVADYEGNMSTLRLKIQRKENEKPLASEPFHLMFSPEKANLLIYGKLTLSSEVDAVYSKLPVFMKTTTNEMGELETVEVGKATTAIKKSFLLTVSKDLLSKRASPTKTHMEWYDIRKKKWYSMGGEIEDEAMQVHLSRLGKYRIALDTVPPFIQPLVLGNDSKKKTIWKFKITDETNVLSKRDRLKLSCDINGQWIFSEFDAKNDLLTIPMSEHLKSKSGTIKISAEDGRGNVMYWERQLKAI